MEEVLAELRAQTGLLKELNANISGLRSDMKKPDKEATEKIMADSMKQAFSVLKGTPLEEMMTHMMSKAGGRTPPSGGTA